MHEIQRRLLAMADSKNAAFQARLAPTLPPERFLGVRLPDLRRYAAELAKTPECGEFLTRLPHTYYDENILHAVLLCKIRDYAACLAAVRAFLPYVDNWAVCDTLRPAVFARHRAELLPEVREWIASPAPYTCRFGMEMLMCHYMDDDFRPELLALPAAVESGDYYVYMMTAWYYATALTKQWGAALPWLTEHRLPLRIHRAAIRKACESRCVSDEHKALLKTLR